MLNVGDVVEGSDLFPGRFQVDQLDTMDGVPVAHLVPEGCVGLAASGIAQDATLFALSEIVQQDDGTWVLEPDLYHDGPWEV